MLGAFSSIRLLGLGAIALAAWFAYGWGLEVISNYGEMAAKIQKLERDKVLIESRVASYKTLMARRDAAIEASQCKTQIERWVKNPDEIPTKWDPFNQLNNR